MDAAASETALDRLHTRSGRSVQYLSDCITSSAHLWPEKRSHRHAARGVQLLPSEVIIGPGCGTARLATSPDATGVASTYSRIAKVTANSSFLRLVSHQSAAAVLATRAAKVTAPIHRSKNVHSVHPRMS